MSDEPRTADRRPVRFEVNADGVATVWLSRPHRKNAWTGRMHAEYRSVMATLDADPAVRVAVVTGEGDAFCVGGDSDALAGHAERGSYDSGLPAEAATPGQGVRPAWDGEFVWHYGLHFPVIAAVNGACAGVGLALVCFHDLRFAAATAKLTTAAPKLGLPAEYGLSWTLPRFVGVTRAADLLLSGRIVTAAEVADWGLFNEVVPVDELMPLVLAYATNLARHVSPASITATKRQMYDDLLRHDPGQSVADSLRLINEMTAGPDYREGVSALREKRTPHF